MRFFYKESQGNTTRQKDNTTHPRQLFFKEKISCLGWDLTHDRPLSRQRSYQLSYHVYMHAHIQICTCRLCMCMGYVLLITHSMIKPFLSVLTLSIVIKSLLNILLYRRRCKGGVDAKPSSNCASTVCTCTMYMYCEHMLPWLQTAYQCMRLMNSLPCGACYRQWSLLIGGVLKAKTSFG